MVPMPRLEEELRTVRNRHAEDVERFNAQMSRLVSGAITSAALRRSTDASRKDLDAMETATIATTSSKVAASVRETQAEFNPEQARFARAIKDTFKFNAPELARHDDGLPTAGPHLGWVKSKGGTKNNDGWLRDPQVTRRLVAYNAAVNDLTKGLLNDAQGWFEKYRAWLAAGEIGDIDEALARQVQEAWDALAKQCNNYKDANGCNLLDKQPKPPKPGQKYPWSDAYGDRSYLLRLIPTPSADEVSHIVDVAKGILAQHSKAYCELKHLPLPPDDMQMDVLP